MDKEIVERNREFIKNMPQIIESKKWHIIKEMLDNTRQMAHHKLNEKNHMIKGRDYYNRKDLEYTPMGVAFSEKGTLNEDNAYVPRFSVNNRFHKIFSEFPVNKQLKYNRDLMIKAIQYGMILQIQYRGEEDNFTQGHSRIIYPMVLGKSSKGKELLRGYHLKGWSVSQSGNIDKVWRMFRTDRILSMSFVGNFYRLPPEGYNMDDKGMRGGIVISADFQKIRRNQQQLVSNNVVQNKRDVVMDKDKTKVETVIVDPTNTVLDLKQPFENINIEEKDKELIRLTFLKPAFTSGRPIAILGALGRQNKVVKVYTQENKLLGTYKVIRSFTGEGLGKKGQSDIENKTEFDLYIFIEKKS